MVSYFSSSSSSEVSHGDFFSLFVDGSDHYWVVSNDYSTVYAGPLDLSNALKLMNSSNEYFNILNSKGLFSL